MGKMALGLLQVPAGISCIFTIQCADRYPEDYPCALLTVLVTADHAACTSHSRLRTAPAPRRRHDDCRLLRARLCRRYPVRPQAAAAGMAGPAHRHQAHPARGPRRPGGAASPPGAPPARPCHAAALLPGHGAAPRRILAAATAARP